MAHTSLVILLKNIPLNPDYANTLVFSSVLAQSSYFLLKESYRFQDLYYIRGNQIQIPNQAGQYRTCTYLMYQNPDFQNKWFYAFITNVEYLNDGTTVITYQEDVIQTWFFEMTIGQCFVQREHVADDTIGKHIKEEPVANGPYITTSAQTKFFTEWKTLALCAVQPSLPESVSEPEFMEGTISGFNWILYQNTSAGLERLKEDIDSLAEAGKSDAMISLWSVPGFLVGASTNGLTIADSVLVNTPFYINLNTITNLNGYVPKNNKLLTYPYCVIEVGATTGQNMTLRQEFFTGDKQLEYLGSAAPNGRIILMPTHYEGLTPNLNYVVSIGDYPQGSWTQDVYSNWLATQSIKWNYEEEERAINWATDMTTSGLTGLGNLAVGNLRGGVNSLTDMVNQTVQYEKNEFLAGEAIAVEKEIHKITPPAAKGSIGSDATMIASNNYGFKIYYRTITAEYAKSIDDYFSMFGYRVDEVKTPNLFSRTSWNYVKTAGAVVTGNAPLYARELFRNLLDTGIRFWHGDYVGDYSRNNGIMGGDNNA